MPYEEELAHRVRELLAGERGVSEMSMFGGLAFMVHGNMAVAVSSKGGLMLRCDPEDMDAALARAHTAPMLMRGRPARGWLRVAADGLRTRRQLEPWVRRGVAFARSLPPKGLSTPARSKTTAAPPARRSS